jgi:hypothetical protein
MNALCTLRVIMLSECPAVATIPVSDLARVRWFCLEILGLKLLEERRDELSFECADGTSFSVFVRRVEPRAPTRSCRSSLVISTPRGGLAGSRRAV